MPVRTVSLGTTRARLRRLVRRHRRPIAACLAAIGVLAGLSSVRTGTAATAGDPDTGVRATTSVRTGEVAVPVVLSSAGVVAALHVGDVIDVIGLTGRETATAAVVAPRARVIEIPAGGSGLTGSSSAVIIVAVAEHDALPLSAASANGTLSVVIRPH
jgi:hypothetical protein